MTPFKFEYIWLDGYQPEANLISLNLSYMQNPEKPDVFDITKGKF